MKGISLSEQRKLKIISLKESGKSIRKIADLVKIPSSTVAYILNKYESVGTIQDRRSKNKGNLTKTIKKRKTKNSRRNAAIVKFVKHNRKSSSNEIRAKLKLQVSTSAIRRILNKNGYNARKPAYKPNLTRSQVQSRLNFCSKYEK